MGSVVKWIKIAENSTVKKVYVRAAMKVMRKWMGSAQNCPCWLHNVKDASIGMKDCVGSALKAGTSVRVSVCRWMIYAVCGKMMGLAYGAMEGMWWKQASVWGIKHSWFIWLMGSVLNGMIICVCDVRKEPISTRKACAQLWVTSATPGTHTMAFAFPVTLAMISCLESVSSWSSNSSVTLAATSGIGTLKPASNAPPDSTWLQTVACLSLTTVKIIMTSDSAPVVSKVINWRRETVFWWKKKSWTLDARLGIGKIRFVWVAPLDGWRLIVAANRFPTTVRSLIS